MTRLTGRIELNKTGGGFCWIETPEGARYWVNKSEFEHPFHMRAGEIFEFSPGNGRKGPIATELKMLKYEDVLADIKQALVP